MEAQITKKEKERKRKEFFLRVFEHCFQKVSIAAMCLLYFATSLCFVRELPTVDVSPSRSITECALNSEISQTGLCTDKA